jgi:hypothetical protein
MRSSYDTLLSIYEWGKIMGIDPWNLAQFGTGFPSTGRDRHRSCQYVWFQHQWQRDFLSREEIGGAIEKAEAALANELTYWPAPKYIEETADLWNRVSSRHSYARGLDSRWQWNSVSMKWGRIQGGGTLARTSVGVGTIVMSDPDGDGLKEKFTITIATTVTEASEIGIYFISADRGGEPLDETWRIRPVVVTISGGNAIITGHPSLLVPPLLESVYDAEELDVSDPANYVLTVDVYRVYRDTTATDANPAQGYALWESRPENPNSQSPADQSTSPIFVGERFAEMGQIYAAFLNCGLCSGWREPDRVRVKYLAGTPRENDGRMNQMMADIVAHLATAWLPGGSCGCERADRIISWWRALPNEGAEKSRLVTFNEIQNTFGERRGASYAYWRMLRVRELGFANG